MAEPPDRTARTPDKRISFGCDVVPGSSCVFGSGAIVRDGAGHRVDRVRIDCRRAPGGRSRVRAAAYPRRVTDLERTADARRVVEYEVALDPVRTLGPLRHSGTDPTSARHGDTYWKALHTAAGPTTVAARPTGPREVTFWAWGAGSGAALAEVDAWLGLADPLESFDPSLHPVVQRLARSRRGVRMGRFGSVFERIVATVLGQLVIAKEAKRSHHRLIRRFGAPAPGPLDLRLSPGPDALAEVGSHEFHRLGVERKRADIIRRVARVGGRVDATAELDPADAYAYLLSIPGIGPWTVTSIGRVCFGDADAVVVGDYNLPHTVAWALAGKRRSDDTEMLELLAPFAGHRGRVQAMLKGAGKPPRHGPKLPFRHVERH